MAFVFSPFTGSFTATGPIFIPVTTYSPTVANAPTGTVTARYWRVGDRLFIQGEIAVTAAGSASVTEVPIPTQFTIDTAKLGAVNSTVVGTIKYFKSGSGSYSGVSVYKSSTGIAFISASKISNALLGSDFANNDVIGWEASLPIL